MQETETPTKPLWQKSDTMELIKVMNDFGVTTNIEKLNNNELYIEVANKLLENGYSRTYKQCKMKWKELVETYNEHKKSNSSSSTMPILYLKELDKILCVVNSQSPKINACEPAWNQFETSFLIKVMKMGNYIDKLKTDEPLNVYEQIAQYMRKVGPVCRTREDIQQRWKNLKQSYIKYIRGDLLHFKYFEELDALLDWEPNSVAFEEDQFKDGHEYGDNDYQNPDDFETKNTACSGKRALNWTHRETEQLLDVVQKYKLQNMKRDSVAAVFDEASMQLRTLGFKRSAEQCRVKFKHLKVKYFSALRKIAAAVDESVSVDDTNPERYFYHFDRMREIMQCTDDNENSDTHEENYEIEYLDEQQLVDADVDHDVNDAPTFDTFEKVYVKGQSSPPMISLRASNSQSASRKSRMIWSHSETQYLLKLLKVRNVKRYCRRPMFEEIARAMSHAGYVRSAQMCMIKWKNLRNQLYASIRNMVEGKDDPCPFYDEICEIVHKDGQVDMTPTDYDDDDSEDEQQSIDLVENKKRSFPLIYYENADKRFKNSETNTEMSDTSSMYVCNYKMDDVEHYCMSLAPTFKRLPKYKQAKLRIEMQKLLYKAEFEPDF